MVPVEKMLELGAVVNFWQSRVDSLSSELGALQDARMHGRPGGDRYAADRLLREIKRKTAEIDNTRQSLRRAERDLGEVLENAGGLQPIPSHIHPPSFDQVQAAH